MIEIGYKLVCSQLIRTYYVTINKIINVYFSQMTYLMSYATSLNNTYGWFYKPSHSRLQQTGYKPVCSQTLSEKKMKVVLIFFSCLE
jgi:hypothetical protein